MDRCHLCGQDPESHHELCPGARVSSSRVFIDADEVARGRAALEADPTRINLPASDPETEPAPAPPEPAGSVPWSIPIRERATPAPGPRGSGDAEQRRLLALVAGGVALLVVAIVGALLIGDDSGSPRSTAVAGSEVTRVTDPPTTAPEVPTPTPTTAQASTTTAPSTTVAPMTTPAAATVRIDTGDVPILEPGEIGRGWVAQVSSVPRSAGGSALQTAYATVAESAPSAVAITSDDWPALRNGYWVIVVPGFDTGAEAVGGCDAASRGGADCFARYLSANAEQNARTCARAGDGGLSGDCGA